jgi:ribokinase
MGDRPLRVAVVGHIEWVDFVWLESYPAEGQVAHATEWHARVGGGGGVAAAVLADMGAEVEFFTSFGRDANGVAACKQLEQRGVRVHVAWREQTMTRRAITYFSKGGERTIVTIGERLAPHGSDPLDWERLAGADGVYFTAGDPGALDRARQARVVVASPRGREALEERSDDLTLDALVFSDHDLDERGWAAGLEARTRLMVATEGSEGGHWWGPGASGPGRWNPAPLPGPARDTYGCGDSFAAAFTFGLARGDSVASAVALGAEWGARAATRPGAP